MRLTFVCSLLIFLSGCLAHTASVSRDTELVRGKPYWYWNPSEGSIGGVGEAGFHLRGTSAQRQLAVSRAIDEVARQKGVRVSTVHEITQSASNSGAEQSMLNTYSIHTVEGVKLTVRMRELWQDNDKIYVWVTEE